MKRWYSYLIIGLLVLGGLEYYFLPKVTGPLHFDMIWNTNNKQSGALVRKGEEVPEEILALRERHHLRRLTEMENGTRVRDVANGIYGFAPCDVQTVNAARMNSSALEIHKHLDSGSSIMWDRLGRPCRKVFDPSEKLSHPRIV